ncbi:MAG: helicase-related protein, partial [Beijerinckiaceae bacterium]
RHAQLRALLGAKAGLVHGKMAGADKDAAVAAFADGATRVLGSTTVIEVGVDVPNASIMIIEHAERFGLAQLHQLRGRVGRGAASSSCVLLYKAPLGETAKARIAMLRETEDGFRIAEEDLRLRGEGDVLGSRQSGQPGFRLADMSVHASLVPVARDDAMLHHSRDPDLSTPRGKALRTLLYLFERDEAVKLLSSG